MRSSFVLLTFFIVMRSAAQMETNNWYFGERAALNFDTNPPTIITGSSLIATHCSSSISDLSGNLLFYTSGAMVWDRFHQVMANGTGLFGGFPSSSQNVITLKQPGNPNLFFIIYSDSQGGPLYYSVVDMSLAGGNGSVTIKNIQLANSTSDAIAAVRHCNGSDIWIITHDYQSVNFRVFLLNNNGVNTNPVLSAGTTTVGNFDCMKASPNGRKLAISYATLFFFELYDFDPATGAITGPPLALFASSGGVLCLGCEFSPDGTKFYGSMQGPSNEIYQWDLCAGTNSQIISSKYIIGVQLVNGYPGQLQLARNGKIYVAQKGTTVLSYYYLSVINNPNASGVACNFVVNGQSLIPNASSWGLPNFLQSSLRDLHPGFSASLSCSSVSLAPLPTGWIPGCSAAALPAGFFSWHFGDSSGGWVSGPAAFHTYTATGTYTVKMVAHYSCGRDTIAQSMTINQLGSQIALSGDSSLCPGVQATVNASGAQSYTWSNGQTGSQAVFLPQSSWAYSVTGTDVNGCLIAKQFSLNLLPAPMVLINGPDMVCFGDTARFTLSGAASYSWNVLPSSSLVVFPATTSGNYTVSANSGGCTGVSLVSLNVSVCDGISELQYENLRVYPNPSNGIVFLSKACSSILVSDYKGRDILYLSGTQAPIESFQVPDPGFYILKIGIRGRFLYRKLIINE